MNLKSIKSANVSFNSQGKIVIEQWDDNLNHPVMIFLTLDQFEALDTWVFRNRADIELAWNSGVDDA
jgi:hypothetical protein